MVDTGVVLTGLGVLALASAVVFWRGSPLQRRVMTFAVVCWAGSAIGQFATGLPAAPIVVGDLVFAAGLLWLLLRHHRPWLYLIFAIEALRLLLHAVAYEFAIGPSMTYRLANNALSTLGLVAIVAASLWPRKGEAPAPAVSDADG